MVSILYNALILPLLRMALWAGRALSPKLRLRSGAEKEALRRAAQTSGKPRILFHASSMGELEQVIPIMHELKRRMPNSCIILSCSSPSGYNHALRQPCIDAALYLPVDTRRNARRFIEATSPDVFVINRYDVWPNVVKTAVSRCRVLLINATYPSVADSPLLRKWVKKFYRKISSITAVSDSDATKLSALCDRPIHHIPDTRVDRVLERIASADATTDILRSTGRPTLLLGSTWPEDEDLLFATLLKIDASRLRLIIVPHEPTEQALKRIEQHVSCQRLSRIQPPYDGNVLVDSVGHLLSLYRLADAAYVGGGFGAGVHSTTEPVGYGLPVACGPHIARSRDAQEYHRSVLLSIVSTSAELSSWIQTTVLDRSAREAASLQSKHYLAQRTGSAHVYAEMIVDELTSN